MGARRDKWYESRSSTVSTSEHRGKENPLLSNLVLQFSPFKGYYCFATYLDPKWNEYLNYAVIDPLSSG